MNKKNKKEACKIEFFNNKKSLGAFGLVSRSTELDRRIILSSHDIKEWTHYTIDGNRCFVVNLSKNYFLYGTGEVHVDKLDKLRLEIQSVQSEGS